MTQNVYPPSTTTKTTAFIDEKKYRELYQRSIDAPEAFWAEQAQKFITWIEPWEKVFRGGFDQLDMQWFAGAKLNAAFNCLDRHLTTLASSPAIIWQGDNPNHHQTVSYAELHERVCRFANVLKRFGIKKGSRVCIYLPMIPEVVVAMLACARIGATHVVVFAGFSAQALQTRVVDAHCELIITANESTRGGKSYPLKQNVDQALQGETKVKTVIIVRRTEKVVPWEHGRDHWYHNLIAQAHRECPIETMDALDPLFILHTSGSTGAPKGVVHGTAGYLVFVAMTFKYVFDYHRRDIYWCTADVGWITGHSYVVYGPLLNGATCVMYEGVPNFPTPSRYWEIIDEYKVNIFYTAPTAIRALRREGNQWVKRTQRKSLRVLGTVGEPINPDAWDWYYRIVGEGRCVIVDTWWQTETGGIMIAPLPGATPLKPGSATWPFFGVSPQIVDDNGNPLPDGQMGRLVITKPWPGLMLTIDGNVDRFAQYFREVPGYYLTGDQAFRDSEGYYWIAGRTDDVIKVSGHRIGTADVESALLTHPAVAEAAVVPIPDDIKGQAIYAFVTLRQGLNATDNLKTELLNTVKKEIGNIATPSTIQWAENLPKTRSGKIMRRILRKIANNETDLGDLSTLSDPQVVNELKQKRKNES